MERAAPIRFQGSPCECLQCAAAPDAGGPLRSAITTTHAAPSRDPPRLPRPVGSIRPVVDSTGTAARFNGSSGRVTRHTCFTHPPWPQGVTFAVPGTSKCPGVVFPLPVVSGMWAWAFIVPWLQAAAERCWVIDTSPNAGTAEAATIPPVRSTDRITLRILPSFLMQLSVLACQPRLVPRSAQTQRCRAAIVGKVQVDIEQVGGFASIPRGDLSFRSSRIPEKERILPLQLQERLLQDVEMYYERPGGTVWALA